MILLESSASALTTVYSALWHSLGMPSDPGLASGVAVATIVAAAATTLSAIVIAFQAWYTRRSVQASNKAVEVAEKALRESQIARIESVVPSLSLRVDAAPPSDDLRIVDPETRRRVPVEHDRVFVIPRDNDLELSILYDFQIVNDGPTTAHLRGAPGTGVTVTMNQRCKNLPAGTEEQVRLVITHTLADWVEFARPVPEEKPHRYLRKYPECARAGVIHEGPRDADVTETHTVVITGSALCPIDGSDGRRWRPYTRDDYARTTLRAEVQPATREYWRSRSSGERF